MTDWRFVRTVTARALAWAVAGSVAFVVALTILVPRLGGGTAYTILTGSMRPTMPPGTVVVVRHEPADQIQTGDVITYQLKSGDPTVVTHRVVSVGVGSTGELRFITQGDANNAPDAAAVRPVQIKGVRWYSVPWVGYPSLVVGTGIRELVVTGAVALLLAYAITMFASELRDRRRRKAVAPAPETAERVLTGVGS